MTGNRRELPLPRVAGQRASPVPHSAFEGSPCGRAHPLLGAEGKRGRSGLVKGMLGGDRPDEAGEFTSAGDDDLLVRLAAGGHPNPAAVKALLGPPGALDHDRIRLALATGQRVADLRSKPWVPGGLDQQTGGRSSSVVGRWAVTAGAVDVGGSCAPEISPKPASSDQNQKRARRA
jgi:hypothetical protein